MSRSIIAIAVVEYKGRFLIGRRANHVVLSGFWEFPGGKVEPNESIKSAAVRECLEETGLVVEVIEHELTSTESYDHGDVELHFYRCRIGDSSHSDIPQAPFIWADKADLHRFEFPRGNVEILSRIRDE
jgi:8-oxo-dGTP diphosphatase